MLYFSDHTTGGSMHIRRVIAIAGTAGLVCLLSSRPADAQIDGPRMFKMPTVEDVLFDASGARNDFRDGLQELAEGYHNAKTRKKAAAKIEESIDAVLRYLHFVSHDRPLVPP